MSIDEEVASSDATVRHLRMPDSSVGGTPQLIEE
jgi:hypothetical protein